jgi:integrase/recombinase XerD
LFIALCLYAGLRASEAANAKWEWFDWRQGTITVQSTDDQFSTKSKRFRVIPLHSRLREILQPLRKPKAYLINPEKTEPGKWRIRYEPKKAFAAVVKAAGVEWCTPHVLRHTFASQLVQAGVSLYKVSQWLGHSDTRTTQIYAHLAPVDDDINRF